MNTREFVIDTDKKIYLYGENPTSNSAKEMLISNNYIFAGLIDRKYEESNVSRNIIAIKDIPKLEDIKTGIFVICLSDGTKHAKIAESLNALGVENIIYYPTEESVSYEYAHLIRKAYVDFVCGDIADITYVLPSYSLLHAGKDIIRRTTHNIHFCCDVKLLHTATKELIGTAITDTVKPVAERFSDYIDIPLIDYNLPIELFKYFSGDDSASYKDYLYTYRDSVEEQKKLLDNRKMLFKIFEQKYEDGRVTFWESPSKVVWNDVGYFNIMDGTHRALYLYSKGVDKIPVVCSKDDYRAYQEKMMK